MTSEELLLYIQPRIESVPGMAHGVVTIPDQIFWNITPEQAEELASAFGTTVFLRLPESEKKFFEWLRSTEPSVWQDLWGMDIPEGESDEPYLVGMGLLPEMVREQRGFPICDLTTEANFFFSIKNFNAEEIKPLIDAILQRMEDKIDVSAKEILLMEIRRAPIDVWRFAYFYRVPVADVKRMVAELVDDGLLRYAASREEMSDFLSWE
ncbi:MAG: hypothetical protein MUF71_18480 [Candidatus Kapabacteria bacterium]|jgi:hypothetical protein|nr:hypothetical protein [Candidatus Kapabacteria bacterium]